MARTSVAALALVALTAACGSTVQLSGTAGEQALGDGLSAPTAAAQDGITPSTGGTGSTSTGGGSALPGTSGTTGTTGTTGPGAGTSGTSGGAVAVPTAPGTSGPRVTTPVKVGVLYLDGADAAAGALGISGLSTGDTRKQAQAVVASLNARGGLAGRKIDLRYGRLDAAGMSSDQEGQHAAACAQLTQDEKVAYVVSYVQLSTSQLACYAKRGVTVLDDQSSTPDAAGKQYAATFGSPGELALGRAAIELVDALWRTGWLTASSKVGTFVFDTADGKALEEKYLVPALRKHGLAAVTARTSNGAGGANQNATVVRYRSAGVDRVIPLAANPLFLMTAAESQGYRPQYAMTSTFGPGALLESSAPRAQLTGAAGIGWSKYLDIGAGKKPGAVSSNETLCFQLMRASGQATTSATTQAFQAAICNVLMFLKDSADRHGVVPDLLDRVRAAAPAFPPADAFAIAMRPGRADGVAAYRDVVFDSGCSCFQYRGGDRPTR